MAKRVAGETRAAGANRAGGTKLATRARAGGAAASVNLLDDVAVTNLQKVLYPSGFTKGQVIEYYRRIAPVLLPHLKNRALTLKRYPNGTDQAYFYEKQCPAYRPEFVDTTIAKGRTWDVNYCVVNNASTLTWVANLASLELHTLLSRAPDLATPTAMVFDLDPTAPAGMSDCVRVALALRDILEGLGLSSCVKTSGSKGLHVGVPLNTKTTFERTKMLARQIADVLVRQDPDRVTSNMSKAQREGKVFVDWSQNDEHKTTVCVYSLRAMREPTVSTPLRWEEVEAAARADNGKSKAGKPDNAHGLRFLAEDVINRVQAFGDLFEPMLKLKRRLPAM